MKASITTQTEKKKDLLGTTLSVIFWIAVWWLVALAVDKQIVLPTPYEVLQALVDIGATAKFWKAVGLSFLRVVAGFAAGSAAGIFLAVLSAKSNAAATLAMPVIGVLRAAPVASFIILALVWFKADVLSAVMAGIMVLPMVYSATLSAIEGIDRKLVEMGQVFRLSRGDIFFKIKVRSVIPAVITACSSALGFAWKAGVAAEVICHPKFALGSMLFDAKTYLETPEVFAVTAVTVVLSVVFERLLKRVAERAEIKRGGDKNADKH